MVQVLGPGETLETGMVRTDDSERFHLAFQPDGNLVVYAHVIAPTVARVALGATNTYKLGPNVRLHLNPGGWLEIINISDGRVLWARPTRIRRYIRKPRGVPGSTLHLQPDGRLVLYRPGGFASSFATWAIAGTSKPVENICVIPNTLIIDISGQGTLESRFNKYVQNDSDKTIGVRDGNTFVALPSGGEAGMFTPGTIAINSTFYDFDSPGKPPSADALPTKVYGPDKKVIRVGGSVKHGFKLV